MSKNPTDTDWIRLLVKAINDKKFHSLFVKDPEAAAAEVKIHIPGTSPLQLTELKSSVKRFGASKSVKVADAKLWAIGLMQHTQLPNHPDDK